MPCGSNLNSWIWNLGDEAQSFSKNQVVGVAKKKSRENSGKFRRLFEETTGVIGGVSGAAIGLLNTGDPLVSMVLGGASNLFNSLLRSTGDEFADRFLGPRERARVGAVLIVIVKDIQANQSKGKKIRADWLFDDGPNGQRDVDQIAESILLKCQREPEEMKIPYMGHLFANIAFRPDISPAMAHQIAKYAERLTYRQYCLLNIARCQKSKGGLRSVDYRGCGKLSLELMQILYEVFDLYIQGFVNFQGEAALGVTDVIPRSMECQGLGYHLSELLEVNLIPNDELNPIITRLQ